MKPLCPGDVVRVVSPSGPVPRDKFERGAARLSRYQLRYDQRIFEKFGFLAGSDEARAAELQAALDDDQTRAIFCARGGYGLFRLLPLLNPKKFLGAPKPIVGFSDVTALHAWLWKLGVPSVHAPVVTQLGSLPDKDVQSLFDLLEGKSAAIEGLRPISAGVAEGKLLGGNLELLSRLCGTPWACQFKDAILLLEDVGERPYRIDRALTQLELTGALQGVAGVVLGDFVDCDEPNGKSPTVDDVLHERLSRLGVPIASGAPIGHGTHNRAVWLGRRARLDTRVGRLELPRERE